MCSLILFCSVVRLECSRIPVKRFGLHVVRWCRPENTTLLATTVESMQWGMLLFLLSIVLLLAHVAADLEILQKDRGVSESFSETQSVDLLWPLIVEQQRTVRTDHVAAVTDKSTQELSTTMTATLGESRSSTAAKRNGANTWSDWNISSAQTRSKMKLRNHFPYTYYSQTNCYKILLHQQNQIQRHMQNLSRH